MDEAYTISYPSLSSNAPRVSIEVKVTPCLDNLFPMYNNLGFISFDNNFY